MRNFSRLPQSEVTQKRHPKTHCLKHPPIKPTPKQPPNQHPKPPKHLVTTGEQSPPPMASKAHHPWPLQVKWKPINEKFSSCHYCHNLPITVVVVLCFYRHYSLQASEPRETKLRYESESEIKSDWRVRRLGEQMVW